MRLSNGQSLILFSDQSEACSEQFTFVILSLEIVLFRFLAPDVRKILKETSPISFGIPFRKPKPKLNFASAGMNDSLSLLSISNFENSVFSVSVSSRQTSAKLYPLNHNI
jgi:hypothetical protein